MGVSFDIELTTEQNLDVDYAQGFKGDPGRGIWSIEKSRSEGIVDYYTITFTDGTTKEIAITNGLDGAVYTPSVDEDGNISWTNQNGLENPPPANIKGPPGIDVVTDDTTNVEYYVGINNGIIYLEEV